MIDISRFNFKLWRCIVITFRRENAYATPPSYCVQIRKIFERFLFYLHDKCFPLQSKLYRRSVAFCPFWGHSQRLCHVIWIFVPRYPYQMPAIVLDYWKWYVRIWFDFRIDEVKELIIIARKGDNFKISFFNKISHVLSYYAPSVSCM